MRRGSGNYWVFEAKQRPEPHLVSTRIKAPMSNRRRAHLERWDSLVGSRRRSNCIPPRSCPLAKPEAPVPPPSSPPSASAAIAPNTLPEVAAAATRLAASPLGRVLRPSLPPSGGLGVRCPCLALARFAIKSAHPKRNFAILAALSASSVSATTPTDLAPAPCPVDGGCAAELDL